MTTTIKNFSKMLVAFVLCAGLVLTSCESADPVSDENSEQGSGENGGNENKPDEGDNGGKEGVMTWTLDAVTEVSATFSGTLDVAASDIPLSQVTINYTDAATFNINNAQKVSTTTFDADQKFTITITGLKPNVKYKYCLIAEVKSEKTYGDVKDFTTVALVAPILNAASKIDHCTATISGKIKQPFETTPSLEYGFEYCTSLDFISDVITKRIVELDYMNNFSIEISSLTNYTTYYYRSYIKMNYVTVYGEPMSFTTLHHPYNTQKDFNTSLATDLSSNGSANSYIVSESGIYKFKTVEGNSTTSVGKVASASILWETFGTSIAPKMLDLISAICYKDGYIFFQTADAFKEGNAVVSAKDANGDILWSWHIWLTDQPQGQTYYNNAGTMMDRNLGATSATPGDVGTLGLFYQWGRKDPFLGPSNIGSNSNTYAQSTITWPSAVFSDLYLGTIGYATKHPTTYINSYNYENDWCYHDTWDRWTTSENTKSIYDPCPVGWRVPDGGKEGVWAKASASWSGFDYPYNSTYEGMDFSGKFGSSSTIWYPAAGCHYDAATIPSHVNEQGIYWSSSLSRDDASIFVLYNSNYSSLGDYSYLSGAKSVRCIQE